MQPFSKNPAHYQPNAQFLCRVEQNPISRAHDVDQPLTARYQSELPGLFAKGVPNFKQIPALEQLRTLPIDRQAALPYFKNACDEYVSVKEIAMYTCLSIGSHEEKQSIIFSLINDDAHNASPEIRERCSIILQLLGLKKGGIIINVENVNFVLPDQHAEFLRVINSNATTLTTIQGILPERRAFLQFSSDSCLEIAQSIASALYEVLYQETGKPEIKTNAFSRLIKLSQDQEITDDARNYFCKVLHNLNSQEKFVGLNLDYSRLQGMDLNGLDLGETLEKLVKRSPIDQATSPYHKNACAQYIKVKELAIASILAKGSIEEKQRVIQFLISEDQNANLPKHLSERASILLQLIQIKKMGVYVSYFEADSLTKFNYTQLTTVTQKHLGDIEKIRKVSPLKSAFVHFNGKYCFEVTHHIANNLYYILSSKEDPIDMDPIAEENKHSLWQPKFPVGTKEKAFYHLLKSSQSASVPDKLKHYLKKIISELNDQAQFTSLTLNSFDLREMDLSNLNLSGSSLANADLSGTNLTNTNLSRTLLMGVKINSSKQFQTNFDHAIWYDTLC